MASPTTELERLADEVFSAVEYDQGKGFVSDALETTGTRKAFFDVVRIHLRHSELAVEKLRAFLRKYDELRP